MIVQVTLQIAGSRFLGLYGLFVSCSILTSFIPVFGSAIRELLTPAIAYVLPTEVALVLPILSLLIGLSFGFQNIFQVTFTVVTFPFDLLAIWAFCKVRDRGMRFGALLAYWIVIMIPIAPVAVYSGFASVAVTTATAQEMLPALGVDPTMKIPTPLVYPILAIQGVVVIATLGFVLWVCVKSLRRYISGMRLLFKRLDPLKTQLQPINLGETQSISRFCDEAPETS